MAAALVFAAWATFNLIRVKDVVDDLKSGITVKGTTLQDFHPTKSVQRTLRKPAEQIKNWTGNAKTKFSKAFKDLTTTDTKMNGRFNDTTILLKAF
mgnify:CR=1 FL=1